MFLVRVGGEFMEFVEVGNKLDDEGFCFIGFVEKVTKDVSFRYGILEYRIKIVPLDKKGWKKQVVYIPIQHFWKPVYTEKKVYSGTALGEYVVKLMEFGFSGSKVTEIMKKMEGNVFRFCRKRIGKMERKVWFPVEFYGSLSEWKGV